MVIEAKEFPPQRVEALTRKITVLKAYREDLLAGKGNLPSRYRESDKTREGQEQHASTYTQRLSTAIGRLEVAKVRYESPSPSPKGRDQEEVVSPSDGVQPTGLRSALRKRSELLKPPTPWDERVNEGRPIDKTDFETVYDRFKHEIYVYIARLVSNPEQAEDLLHDVFEKAYKAFDNGKTLDAEKTRPWIYRIATNTAYDALRRRRRIEWTPLTFAFKEDSEHSGEVLPEGYEENVLEKATADRELIDKVLKRMPPHFAQCILLHFEYGFPVKELAEILGVSEAAAKMRVQRAKYLFRESYREIQESA